MCVLKPTNFSGSMYSCKMVYFPLINKFVVYEIQLHAMSIPFFSRINRYRSRTEEHLILTVTLVENQIIPSMVVEEEKMKMGTHTQTWIRIICRKCFIEILFFAFSCLCLWYIVVLINLFWYGCFEFNIFDYSPWSIMTYDDRNTFQACLSYATLLIKCWKDAISNIQLTSRPYRPVQSVLFPIPIYAHELDERKINHIVPFIVYA